MSGAPDVGAREGEILPEWLEELIEVAWDYAEHLGNPDFDQAEAVEHARAYAAKRRDTARILAALAETREGERIEGWAAQMRVGLPGAYEFASDENFDPGPTSQRATLILHAPPTTQEEP